MNEEGRIIYKYWYNGNTCGEGDIDWIEFPSGIIFDKVSKRYKETPLLPSMKSTQDKIKEWNDARGWSNPGQLKDLLLNMTEEIGEMWNLIKWVDTDTQVKLIHQHKDEVDNFVADMLYLILKVSYICDVNPTTAVDAVMKEYDQRFPLDKAKGSHGNVRAGGIDNK